ncbi:MAG: FAD-dependent monooxygenase [archaeon]
MAELISPSLIKVGYDVIIAGVGPAGCTLAENLSSKYRVLIADYRSLPREKPCGGMLVREAKEFVDKKKMPADIFAGPKYLDIKYMDWNNGTETLIKKGFYNIHREKFDAWLFQSIKANNVNISANTKLIDYYPTKKKNYVVAIFSSDGEIKGAVCKYLIGCDGALSTVRNKLTNTKVPYYIAMQELIDKKLCDDAYFIFDNSITDFYCWAIPKDDKTLIGAAIPPESARERFELFKNKLSKRMGCTSLNGRLSSALLSRPNSIRQTFLGDKNVMLAGEAAGLISPSSGEGISFAQYSGFYCAEAINKEYENALPYYKEKCKPLIERIRAKLRKSEALKNVGKRPYLLK